MSSTSIPLPPLDENTPLEVAQQVENLISRLGNELSQKESFVNSLKKQLATYHETQTKSVNASAQLQTNMETLNIDISKMQLNRRNMRDEIANTKHMIQLKRDKECKILDDIHDIESEMSSQIITLKRSEISKFQAKKEKISEEIIFKEAQLKAIELEMQRRDETNLDNLNRLLKKADTIEREMNDELYYTSIEKLKMAKIVCGTAAKHKHAAKQRKKQDLQQNNDGHDDNGNENESENEDNDEDDVGGDDEDEDDERMEFRKSMIAKRRLKYKNEQQSISEMLVALTDSKQAMNQQILDINGKRDEMQQRMNRGLYTMIKSELSDLKHEFLPNDVHHSHHSHSDDMLGIAKLDTALMMHKNKTSNKNVVTRFFSARNMCASVDADDATANVDDTDTDTATVVKFVECTVIPKLEIDIRYLTDAVHVHQTLHNKHHNVSDGAETESAADSTDVLNMAGNRNYGEMKELLMDFIVHPFMNRYIKSANELILFERRIAHEVVHLSVDEEQTISKISQTQLHFIYGEVLNDLLHEVVFEMISHIYTQMKHLFLYSKQLTTQLILNSFKFEDGLKVIASNCLRQLLIDRQTMFDDIQRQRAGDKELNVINDANMDVETEEEEEADEKKMETVESFTSVSMRTKKSQMMSTAITTTLLGIFYANQPANI